MRIVRIEKEIYKFNELPQAAKEKIKQDYINDYCNGWFYEDFTENALEILLKKFPNSELKAQADFSYCQGSGCNIFGKFSMLDYPEKFVNKDGLSWFADILPEIYLAENDRYTFSLHTELRAVQESETIIELFNCNAYYYSLTTEGKEQVSEIVKNIFSEIAETEQEIFAMGKNMLEIDDEQMAEISDCNGWEYLADGSLWEGR